jgi:hypothetical protein
MRTIRRVNPGSLIIVAGLQQVAGHLFESTQATLSDQLDALRAATQIAVKSGAEIQVICPTTAAK